jgi:hypothetical protein
VIACYVDYSSATFGKTQYAANYVGMALFPAPFVLLNLPNVQDVAYEIQCFAGIVFEEVIELVGLTISSA